MTKRLVFSSWQVVPRAVSAMLSYEADRRMVRSLDDNPTHTAEARNKRQQLLRFTKTDGRLTGMPILEVTFHVGAEQPVFAGSLLLLYGVGHCSIIVAAGSVSGWVQRYLNWNQQSGTVVWLRRLCGVGVILGGLWLIYTAPG